MSLDHILLGLLREPASGYDLRRAFSETVAHFWSAELSQIYPTLKRLERRGLLRSRREPSSKGPDRRVYSLTSEGEAELHRWLRNDPAVGTERFAYLAQLFFMDSIDDLERTYDFMTALRDHLRGRLADLRAVEREIIAAHGEEPERYGDAGFHRFATLRMGIHSIGAKVTWCNLTLAAIDRRLASRPVLTAPASEDPQGGSDDPQ
ncbi:PadR family transcriptional regulator [Candidatus Palauibacter sp.]|uniref:PadR family transcriptional regulator n=1 Tax=Candidatus Palauibacter sp. TaxID=3101350 RepID=UPI003B010B52